VLVRPQLGENIGACARAMRNCGLADLRLVAPRDGWPNERARAAATGAVGVVDAARVFERVEDAIADLGLVFATTARRRDMLKEAVPLEEAVTELRQAGVRAGFLFGPERTGLDNEDVLLANKVLHIPLDPSFQSLNLAQAVLLVSTKYFASGRRAERATMPPAGPRGRGQRKPPWIGARPRLPSCRTCSSISKGSSTTPTSSGPRRSEPRRCTACATRCNAAGCAATKCGCCTA
jgi:tRNA C32,U32 (ribose-2'-O)-methylase TrmJ